jgi:hypothetical protein
MRHIRCPVVGCGKRKVAWSGKRGYRLPSSFAFEVDQQLAVKSTRICLDCYMHHVDHTLPLHGRTRVTSLRIDLLLTAAKLNPLSPLSPSLAPVILPRLPLPPSLLSFPPAPHTTLASAAISLGETSLLFTTHFIVLEALYSPHSAHPGLTFWSLDHAGFPLTAAAALRPPHFNSIRSTPATTYHMPVVPFNLPDHSEVVEGELPSQYRRRGLRKTSKRLSGNVDSKSDNDDDDDDVLCDVKESHQPPLKKPRMVMYQKDNEQFSAWQSPVDTSLSVPLLETTVPIYSPFNTHLFSLEPTNLCSLMSDFPFHGFSSPSWYVKEPGSFFCQHVEQLFAPFYNICYEGSTTWWVVRREDREVLDQYLVKRAKQWYGVSEGVDLSYEEERAVEGLLLTKAVVFHPDDVAEAGVRLSKVKQVASSVVVRDGDLVHFGTGSHSINEAINFLPLQWLTTGLPRLVTWMQWLRDSWIPMQQPEALPGQSKAKLRDAIQDARTNYLVALHCSPLWCLEFVGRLRTLLAKGTRNTRYYAMREAIVVYLKDDAGITKVLEDLDEVSKMMTKDGKVRQWLLKNSTLNENEKPRTGFL